MFHKLKNVVQFYTKILVSAPLKNELSVILFVANVIKSDARLTFLSDLIPEPVSVQTALEAQRARGLTSTSTAMVEDSLSEVGRSKSNSSSISDFFAKKSVMSSADIDIEDQ